MTLRIKEAFYIQKDVWIKEETSHSTASEGSQSFNELLVQQILCDIIALLQLRIFQSVFVLFWTKLWDPWEESWHVHTHLLHLK